MSASLVGSEMCIRDRKSHAHLIHCCARMADAAANATCAEPRLAYTAEAVSYTHLTLPTICSV
eukprot:9709132-Alexandrium_andersonii.AAC.1